MHTDYLIPLGGGNEIGASAYFLSIDGVNMLLDCGARLAGEEIFPDYDRLLDEINDFFDIDLILISHAHYDHIGSLVRIASLAVTADIICTEDTKRLISLQLLDFGRISGRNESQTVIDERYRQANGILSRIQTKPVMRSFKVKGCQITFMPAGHMPGAVMTDLVTQNHHLFYSGDFSTKTMFELNTFRLLPDLHPDILLLNAPYAYTDRSVQQGKVQEAIDNRSDNHHYQWLKKHIRQYLDHHNKVYLTSISIPKHLDLFYFLKEEFGDVPVFLEKKSKKIFESLLDMGYGISGINIHDAEQCPTESAACIIVGQNKRRPGCISISFDMYSLHASQEELLKMIRTLNAGSVYLLHTDPDPERRSLIEAAQDASVQSQLIQTENGIKYLIKRRTKMQYQGILDEILDQELVSAISEQKKERAFDSKIAKDWLPIIGSLLFPDLHPRDAYNKSVHQFGAKDILYDDYLRSLRSCNLDAADRRYYIKGRVEEAVGWLKNALNGDGRSAEKFDVFSQDLGPRDVKNRRLFFLGKYLVCYILIIDPDLKNEKYMPIATAFGSGYCDRLIRRIRDRLLHTLGLQSSKKSARDVLKKTEAALIESASDISPEYSFKNEMEKLRFENDNYRNSLELVQSMLDELNETIDQQASDAKDTAITAFFTSMNADTYGNLLDSIEVVDRRLTELKEDKVKIPPRLLPLTIVFKQLLRFVKDSGITPIDTTGRIFETNAEGLDDYTYIGEAFNADEKKAVIVEKPGWRYASTIISLPTVREKEEDD